MTDVAFAIAGLAIVVGLCGYHLARIANALEAKKESSNV